MSEDEQAKANVVIKTLTRVIEDIRDGVIVVDSFEINKRWVDCEGNRYSLTLDGDLIEKVKE